MTTHKRHCSHRQNDYGFSSNDLVKIVEIGAITSIGLAVLNTATK